MCGLAARGLWADMLALMHEAVPYGHLLVNAVAPSHKQLALLVGATERDCRGLVGELRDAGVFSETNEGVIYSRRMVRDEIKATQDRENGKGGGNPRLIERDNIGVNPPDKAQRLEARAQKLEEKSIHGCEDAFERLWKAYPHRGSHADPKKPARERFVRIVQAGADPETIIAAATRYAATMRGKDPQHVAQLVTWLNQARWEQYEAGSETAGGAAIGENPVEKRMACLERLLADDRWYLHYGPKPTPDEARAELGGLREKLENLEAA